MGTNKCASQSGMTAYGTRRHLYDPKNHILPPMDHSTISLQMGTNKCASQVGLTQFPQTPTPSLLEVSRASRNFTFSPNNPALGFPLASILVPSLFLCVSLLCPQGSYYRDLCFSFPPGIASRPTQH